MLIYVLLEVHSSSVMPQVCVGFKLREGVAHSWQLGINMMIKKGGVRKRSKFKKSDAIVNDRRIDG